MIYLNHLDPVPTGHQSTQHSHKLGIEIRCLLFLFTKLPLSHLERPQLLGYLHAAAQQFSDLMNYRDIRIKFMSQNQSYCDIEDKVQSKSAFSTQKEAYLGSTEKRVNHLLPLCSLKFGLLMKNTINETW